MNFIAQGIGIFENQQHSSDVQGCRADAAGALIGADVAVTENLDFGLSLTYLWTDVRLKAGRSDHEINTFCIGPYASYTSGPWFVDASATYGYHRFDSTLRNPAIGTEGTSKHDGHDFSAYLGTGWQLEVSENVQLTPIGSLQYTYLREESFRISGPSAMEVDARSADSLRSRLGVHAEYVVAAGDVTFVPEASVGWERELLSQDHRATARFVAGGDAFSVRAGEPGKDAAFVSAGLTALLSEQVSTFVRYDGLYYSDGDAHAITGGMTLRF